MTPRDELRELPWVVDDNTGVRWIDEPSLLAALPSLPVDGGDGPREVWLTWGWNGDDEYTLLGVHATRERAQAHIDSAEPVEVEGPYGSDTHAELDGMRFRGLEGPDRREVFGAPVSSSAGDEAREALAPALRGALWDLAPSKAKEEALVRLLAAALPSPLQGAGDGLEVADRIAEGLLAYERRLSHTGGRVRWRDLTNDELREVVRELAAAPLSGVEQTKETTRDA